MAKKPKCKICDNLLSEEEMREYNGCCYNCYYGVNKDCMEIEAE